MASLIALSAGGALLGGCGGSSHPSPQQLAADRVYLARLTDEQAKLARAERRIPQRAGSPAALSRSIRLLDLAIGRLGTDLEKIDAPPSVASLHGRLVSIVRGYAQQLSAIARQARARGGELGAANALLASTHAASSGFSSTVAAIDSRIKQ